MYSDNGGLLCYTVMVHDHCSYNQYTAPTEALLLDSGTHEDLDGFGMNNHGKFLFYRLVVIPKGILNHVCVY